MKSEQKFLLSFSVRNFGWSLVFYDMNKKIIIPPADLNSHLMNFVGWELSINDGGASFSGNVKGLTVPVIEDHPTLIKFSYQNSWRCSDYHFFSEKGGLLAGKLERKNVATGELIKFSAYSFPLEQASGLSYLCLEKTYRPESFITYVKIMSASGVKHTIVVPDDDYLEKYKKTDQFKLFLEKLEEANVIYKLFLEKLEEANAIYQKK